MSLVDNLFKQGNIWGVVIMVVFVAAIWGAQSLVESGHTWARYIQWLLGGGLLVVVVVVFGGLGRKKRR